MNEKFFDLKKEKQDRMINAALKIFALNGYNHASTDDIVKEAGISKGLLFHYFTNKIGLYSFIFDYSVRYISLEMTSTVDKADNDYFSLYTQIMASYTNVMKSYPYMVMFVNSVQDENVVEALNEIAGKKNAVKVKVREFIDYANTSYVNAGTDITRLDDIITYTSEAVLKKSLLINDQRPELFYDDMKKYLLTLKQASYR